MLSTTSAAAYEFLKVSTERDGTVYDPLPSSL